MDARPIQQAEIKVARAAPTKDKTHLALVAHAIKQAKALHFLRRGVALALAAFADRGFVQLPIVATHPFEQIECAVRLRHGMATDAAGIHQVRLCQLIRDAYVFRQIAIRQMHPREQALGLLIDRPADDSHLRRVSESSTPLPDLVFLVSSMKVVVARLAKGNQVIQAISPSFARLEKPVNHLDGFQVRV